MTNNLPIKVEKIFTLKLESQPLK